MSSKFQEKNVHQIKARSITESIKSQILTTQLQQMLISLSVIL
jgi:hypothetical protein